jgi:hypothetical protein
MRWLNAHEIESLTQRKAEPQWFIFSCEGDLSTALHVEPQQLSTEDGEAWPVNQWVALSNDRLVVVRQDEPPISGELRSAQVLTPFQNAMREQEDWTTLRLLQDLPWPIKPSRPFFIQSRSESREHVVCRPNDRGWYDPIYRATANAEAERLLSYLRSIDSWNESCFIGKMEQRGEWRIVAREGSVERVVGAYPEVESALSFACTLSDKSPNDVLTVTDSESQRSKTFRITRGRVHSAVG